MGASAALRAVDDVGTMARAVQANLYQLKVAQSRRGGRPPADHPLKIASPGTISRFREALLDYHVLQAYSDLEIELRLRETWGQFCLFLWFFKRQGDPKRLDLTLLPADMEARCEGELGVKHAEIQGVLWRLRFEQSKRQDPDFIKRAGFPRENALARQIPLEFEGLSVDQCNEAQLIAAACEHAGMLAAIRWILNPKFTWGQPGIMDVADDPFA